jgi:hypothetical protein
MYSQLLRTAIEDRDGSTSEATPGEFLAELLQRRGNMAALPNPGPGRVPAAVADQLHYDIALVELCRRLGIECDVRTFDQPDSERRRLERALEAKGVIPPSADGVDSALYR